MHSQDARRGHVWGLLPPTFSQFPYSFLVLCKQPFRADQAGCTASCVHGVFRSGRDAGVVALANAGRRSWVQPSSRREGSQTGPACSRLHSYPLHGR